jgi:hypothetical protein
MSGGEISVAFFAAALAAYYWGFWLYDAFQTSRLVHPAPRLLVLILGFIAGHGIVLLALVTGADPVVREDVGYIFLFLAVEAVTLAGVTAAAAIVVVSSLDDAVRRPNQSAVWAVSGLWVGTSIAVAGANLGRGDTIGTTLGPLVIAALILLILLAIFTTATRGLSSVWLDRDVPSGVRLSGLLVAWGLVLGRAAAGDWESVKRTWEDFAAQGWPTVALLAVAIPLELLLRPSPRRPSPLPAAGFAPALTYIAAAIAWVVYLGRPLGLNG